MSERIDHDIDASTIDDSQDFRDALHALVAAGDEAGVDVTGGWRVSVDEESSVAWDVEITRLARRTTHQTSTTEEFPVEAVLAAVASREGVEETELPPLQESIDVESLERVFTDLGESGPGKVTFHYCGYVVTIHGDGQITVAG